MSFIATKQPEKQYWSTLLECVNVHSRDTNECELKWVEYLGEKSIMNSNDVNIITHTKIIKVETATKWKQALGQVIAQSESNERFYMHKLVVALFDSSYYTPTEQKEIERICSIYHVNVQWLESTP